MDITSTGASTGLSVVPTANLFHHRPGWKVAVDLHPAPTAAGASTVVARQSSFYDGDEAEEVVEEEVWAGISAAMPKEVTAGKTMEIVVQARDVYGNHRGIGEWFRCGSRGGGRRQEQSHDELRKTQTDNFDPKIVAQPTCFVLRTQHTTHNTRTQNTRRLTRKTTKKTQEATASKCTLKAPGASSCTAA